MMGNLHRNLIDPILHLEPELQDALRYCDTLFLQNNKHCSLWYLLQ